MRFPKRRAPGGASDAQYVFPDRTDLEELDAIYGRTPDPVKKEPDTRNGKGKKEQPAANDKWTSRKKKKKEEYSLVDGYNIIFAWEELKELAKSDLKVPETS